MRRHARASPGRSTSGLGSGCRPPDAGLPPSPFATGPRPMRRCGPQAKPPTPVSVERYVELYANQLDSGRPACEDVRLQGKGSTNISTSLDLGSASTRMEPKANEPTSNPFQRGLYATIPSQRLRS